MAFLKTVLFNMLQPSNWKCNINKIQNIYSRKIEYDHAKQPKKQTLESFQEWVNNFKRKKKKGNGLKCQTSIRRDEQTRW